MNSNADFDNKDFVVFWGNYQTTKFVRKSDIPEDILNFIHPRNGNKYISCYSGKAIDDINSTCRVNHWIHDLPAWDDDIPLKEKTHIINYSLVNECDEPEYPYM